MSIPTSLIVVLLVAAWLAVLVPMVARRREAVPESETDGGTFRVLRRASASIRRRPRFGARDEVEMGEEYQEDDSVDEDLLDEELLDDDDDFADDDEDDVDEAEFEYEEVALVEEVEYEEVHVGRQPVTVGASSGGSSPWHAEPRMEPHRVGSPPAYPTAPASDGGREYRDLDDPHLRPIPRRSGRGGYDPDAAEAARAYRFSRRRRVTVILLLATIAFSVAGYLYTPILWSGAAVSGLLLIAYLAYLRRQVRIENDIRERRLARLRRARQIRPEYHQLDHLDVPAAAPYARPAAPVSQVPPSGYRRGREIIDLDDDDPSFDDLDYYMPVTYRRASGQ